MTEVYEHEKHYDLICGWLEEYGSPKPNKEDIGKFGIVADGIAAGFLFKTDATACWIDNLVAKKGAAREVKRKAFSKIYLGLESEAIRSGFRWIQNSVNSEMLIDELRDLNYVFGGEYKTFVKDLGE